METLQAFDKYVFERNVIEHVIIKCIQIYIK